MENPANADAPRAARPGTEAAPDGGAEPAGAAPVHPGEVARFRSFSRVFTRAAGAVRPTYLDSPWSLSEVRTFYELLHRGRTQTADLRRALDIDAGQLSRVLAQLEADHLVARAPAPGDRRRSTVELTPAGARAAALMEARADSQVGELLSRLSAADRDRLSTALDTAGRVLDPPAAPAVVLRPPGSGDIGWIVQRHGELYAREYGWNTDYEALVARIAADFAERAGGRTEAGWIAEVDGERAGSIACTRAAADTAQLRLLLVEPWARGRGVGGRLVDACLEFARGAGYRRITLWTQSTLTAARALYTRAGFTRTAEEPHRSFGHDLVAETWDREL